MKKRYLLLLVTMGCLLIAAGEARAQMPAIDSLRAWLAAHPQADTSRVNRLNALGKAVAGSNPTLQLTTAQEALRLAGRLHYEPGQAQAFLNLSLHAMTSNDYPKAIALTQRARQLYIHQNDRRGQANCLNRLAFIAFDQGQYPQSIALIQQAQRLAEPLGDLSLKAYSILLLAQNYTLLDDFANARSYATTGLRLARRANNAREQSRALVVLATISNKEGKLAEARQYFDQVLPLADQLGSTIDRAIGEGNIAEVSEQQGQYADAFRYGRRAWAYFNHLHAVSYLPWIEAVLTHTFLDTGQLDSTLVYGQRSLRGADAGGLRDISAEVSYMLAKVQARRGNYQAAYRYQVRYTVLRDSLKGEETVRQTAALQRRYDQASQQAQIALLTKNQKIEQEHSRAQRVLLIATLGGLLLLLLLAVVLVRSNRASTTANNQLVQQKQALETTLTELRMTQTQLIHAEKMASLGEMTAGIAHEIQNPLNFVNNFSEVSAELVAELEEEQYKSERDPGLEADILSDLKQNLLKITHHGGRASAIVRGMLAHSRTGTGDKRSTDLNALADEYLKIAYQGLRAKDKGFTAELKTNFGTGLSRAQVAPQELGRVLLNLYNNAFYAVREKQKIAPADYQPTVTVHTVEVNGQVEIRVNDNGTGVPDSVKAKIFQPFFTTKPTGEGTGLGLSLSYDIITKGHGGRLLMESREGNETTFVIQLPTGQS